MYRWAVESPHRFRWRFPDRVLPFPEFAQALQPPTVLMQTADAHEPLTNACSCFGFNSRSRYATIAVSWESEPVGDNPGLLLRATTDLVFSKLDIRKLYVKVLATESETLAPGLVGAHREATLRDEVYVDGRYVTEHVFAVWRDR
jgi:hypothetical protein